MVSASVYGLNNLLVSLKKEHTIYSSIIEVISITKWCLVVYKHVGYFIQVAGKAFTQIWNYCSFFKFIGNIKPYFFCINNSFRNFTFYYLLEKFVRYNTKSYAIFDFWSTQISLNNFEYGYFHLCVPVVRYVCELLYIHKTGNAHSNKIFDNSLSLSPT